jgi:hypothetical protein
MDTRAVGDTPEKPRFSAIVAATAGGGVARDTAVPSNPETWMKSGERRTLCWREMDSNFQYRVS